MNIGFFLATTADSVGLFGDKDLKKDQILDWSLHQVKSHKPSSLCCTLEQPYSRESWRILTCSAAQAGMLQSPKLDANGWSHFLSPVTHGQGSTGILL